MSKTFYLTTPLYYVNASPHIGHSYTNVAADCLARFQRLRGLPVHFLTGTDEHGQKIERMARDAGISQKKYADGVVSEFKKTWGRCGISYDRFIRTTDEDHRASVEEMWRRMEARSCRVTPRGADRRQSCTKNSKTFESSLRSIVRAMFSVIGLPGLPP